MRTRDRRGLNNVGMPWFPVNSSNWQRSPVRERRTQNLCQSTWCEDRFTVALMAKRQIGRDSPTRANSGGRQGRRPLRPATLRARLAGALLLYDFSGTHWVLPRSYLYPGAPFKASLVVFMTRYHLSFFFVPLTAWNGTATSFSPAPRKPPTPMMSALTRPS